MTSTRSILKALRPAAVEVNGVPCVRARQLCLALGVPQGRTGDWEDHGNIHPIRVRVPRCKATPGGVLVYYRLDQVPTIVAHCRKRTYTRWRAWEMAVLRRDYGSFPIEELARRIGRPASAVLMMARVQGINEPDSIEKSRGLLRAAKMAGLLRITKQSLAAWIRRGLPVQRGVGSRRHRYFKLEDVRRFLRLNYHTAVVLRPEVLALLRLKLEDQRVLDLHPNPRPRSENFRGERSAA